MARFGVPGQNIDPLAYADERLATVPQVQAPRRPTTSDKKFPIGCEWRVTKKATAPVEEGEYWKLVRFESSGDATWVRFAGGDSGAIISLTGDDSTLIEPDGLGNIDIQGLTVANATNAKPLYFDGTSASSLLECEIQLATIVAPTPGDNTNSGIACYNSNQFQIDATSGMVSLAGNTQNSPILGVVLDDGLEAGANVSGALNLTGTTVANSTNAKPLYTTRNPAGNDMDVQIQLSTASADSNENLAGICYFDNAQFSVNSKGKVTLAGGGLAIDAFSTDVAGPVSPDGTGTVDVTGTSVFSDGTVANTLTLNVQASANTLLYGAGANTTVSELGPLTDGQLVIGSTGNAPVAGTLTAGTGISITNGAGSITIASNAVSGEVGVSNIGFSTSGGTFTVHSADGTDLSASNPGYVTMYSGANPGQTVTVAVTANQTFVDDAGTSTINGNLFGFQAADTTTSDDVPFFLYAVLNDSEDAISFMISRLPGLRKSTAEAVTGKTGTANADSSYSMFALSNPTLADYDSNPALNIGSFRMRLTTAGGDWTVQTLDQEDGIGQFQEQRTFSVPVGIFGAAANTHWKALGGTAPVFTNTQYYYQVTTTGFVFVDIYLNVCSTNGVGAVQAQLVTPFESDDNPHKMFNASIRGEGNADNGGANDKIIYEGTIDVGDGNNYCTFIYSDATAGASGELLNTDITSNETLWRLTGFYKPRTEA